MSDDRKYNGWTNYETWCVNLWLDNDRGTHEHWRTMARATFADAERTPALYESQTASDRARIRLADLLKAEIENETPEVTGMFADLLSAALGAVDWYEIADAILTAEFESSDHAYEARS